MNDEIKQKIENVVNKLKRGIYPTSNLMRLKTIINRHNRCMKTDLLHVTNQENTLDLYSRLSISWGFISDLDIGTEWMRKIGNVRFDLGACWNILRKRKYYGTLEYTNTL